MAHILHSRILRPNGKALSQCQPVSESSAGGKFMESDPAEKSVGFLYLS